MGTLELGTHYHCIPTSHIRFTVRRVGSFFTITLSRAHMLPDRAAILDFVKGAFFEANRGKNHALYLYLPELLISVKGITELVFYFVFSFMVKEGFEKEQRPIANRQLFTSWAFYLIFWLMVLPLQIYQCNLYKTLKQWYSSWKLKYNSCRKIDHCNFNNVFLLIP